MADGKSLTVHASQGHAAPLHDKREYTPPNACRALEANNVSVVRVEDDVQAFNDFFQPHVEAFNEKQKRADRKKSLDYHAEVVERRAKSKDPDHETKPFYEYVIGAGDRNGVMGVTDSEFDNALWRRLKDGYTDEDGNEVGPDYRAADEYVRAHLNEHPDRDELKRALTEHMEGLQERYPNFQFVSIEGHDDEPNGTFHFHVRFFPVADGYKKGMETRCGLNKALAAMGFSGGDQLPITQWQNDVKNGLEEVLKECGYEREYGDGRKYHLDTASFALSEDLEALAEDINGYKAVLDSVMAEEVQASSRVEKFDQHLDAMQGDYYELPNGVRKKGLATLRAEGAEAIAERNAAIADKDAALRQADTVIEETERLLAARKKLEEDDTEAAQDPLAGFAAYLNTSEAGGPGHRSIAKSCLANYRRKLVADKAANGAESADVVKATEEVVKQAKRTLGEARAAGEVAESIEGAVSAPSAGDRQFE